MERPSPRVHQQILGRGPVRVGFQRDSEEPCWAKRDCVRNLSTVFKMGPDSDPMAVVDQYCRVKGVQGLWVADSSVVPRIPRSGGLHPTALMIGERVVDWVAAG